MSISRAVIQAELDEKTIDLKVFWEAREAIRRRVQQVKDSPCQLTPLDNWSGTDAVLGALDLCIHSMERTIEELYDLLEKAVDQPTFTLVRGGKDEPEN
jgi:hypothetical protein